MENLQYVDMIAKGYDWICPNCDVWNEVMEIVETVECINCDKIFYTEYVEHAY